MQQLNNNQIIVNALREELELHRQRKNLIISGKARNKQQCIDELKAHYHYKHNIPLIQ